MNREGQPRGGPEEPRGNTRGSERGPREETRRQGTRRDEPRGAPEKPQKKRRGDREERGPDPTGTPEPDPGR